MLERTPFYLCFTDGWGDEDILECVAVSANAENGRVMLCEVDPPLFVEGKYSDDGQDRSYSRLFLYDRFSTDSWRPVTDDVHVGILVGDHMSSDTKIADLELIERGTVFPSRAEAERARSRLRGE